MMLGGQEKNSWRYDAHGAFTPRGFYGGGSSSTFAEGEFSWVGMERDEGRSPSQIPSVIHKNHLVGFPDAACSFLMIIKHPNFCNSS